MVSVHPLQQNKDIPKIFLRKMNVANAALQGILLASLADEWRI
jgi:hypothetical protein